MMETDHKSIDFRQVYGVWIRVIILGIGLVIGLLSVASEGKMDAGSLLTGVAYLLMILISGTMARLQHKLEYRNYKSVNGQVGAEC